jgi:hypothetical protein
MYDGHMRKHPHPAQRQAVTIARVEADRWVPERSLNGPRCCPEYAVWTLGPSRARSKKPVLR